MLLQILTAKGIEWHDLLYIYIYFLRKIRINIVR